MSVTFSIESLPVGTFVIECMDTYDEETGAFTVVAKADTYEAILIERAAHMLVCDECAHYGCYSKPVMDVTEDFDVNVSNMNAVTLMRALGFDVDAMEGDYYGNIDGEDFLGRVLVAMAEERDDSGVRPVVVGGVDFDGTRVSRGATMIDCGLPEGYFSERFGALHALASEAVRLGRNVVWS